MSCLYEDTNMGIDEKILGREQTRRSALQIAIGFFVASRAQASPVPNNGEKSFLKDVERMERAWGEHVRTFVHDIEEALKQPPQQDFWHNISPLQQSAVLDAVKKFALLGRPEGYLYPQDIFHNIHNKELFRTHIERVLRVQDLPADKAVRCVLFVNNFIWFLFKDAPAE